MDHRPKGQNDSDQSENSDQAKNDWSYHDASAPLNRQRKQFDQLNVKRAIFHNVQINVKSKTPL